jgi:hypothetical protein
MLVLIDDVDRKGRHHPTRNGGAGSTWHIGSLKLSKSISRCNTTELYRTYVPKDGEKIRRWTTTCGQWFYYSFSGGRYNLYSKLN